MQNRFFSSSHRLALLALVGIALLALVVPAAIGKTSGKSIEPTAYVSAGRLNVRSGPASSSSVVTTVDRRAGMPLVGRNADASWVQVRLPGDYIGWVDADYVQTDADLKQLPVTFDSTSLPVQPHLVLSDGVAAPGKSITVMAEGFKANQRVQASLYSVDAGVKQALTTGVTDASGTAQLDVIMPSTWANGQTIDQSNVLLIVGTPDGQVSETANIQYVFGKEATEVPGVVDATFNALRSNDMDGARVHLTGAALRRLEASNGQDTFYNLTGVSNTAGNITGLGSRVTRVSGDRVTADTVLIFGDTYVRMTMELVRVGQQYVIDDMYVSGIYQVQDSNGVG